jgi:hypothetical protein
VRAGAILSHSARPLRRPSRAETAARAHAGAGRMIGITITAEAYEAIAATLPFGSVSFERD